MVSTNDMRPGQSIIVDNVLYQILEYQHVKPGKGKAFVKTKLKNLSSGGNIEKTFRADEDVKQAYIDKQSFQFLYNDSDEYYFMNNESFEQISIDKVVLDGQEVSVGVIQNKNERIILPITEIISDNEFFDYSAKYLGESQEITPGNVSEKSKKLIHEYLNNIYDNINLNGITRSEFIIVNDIPYILETNTIPGFTQQSIVPQQIEAQKLNVKDVINDLIRSIL